MHKQNTLMSNIIRLANLSTSWWSHEIVRWSINVFSHNFWNSPHNFVPWSMTTSVGALSLLNSMSKNAYASLLQFGNGTDSNHLEKWLIIIKTYRLCWGTKFNELAKSKLHQYPSPTIGKSYRWNKFLNLQLHPLPPILYLEQIICSLNPKIGPTPCEACSQGFQVVPGEAQPSFVHLPTFVKGNYFPIWIT
jgi:hypothetical protein